MDRATLVNARRVGLAAALSVATWGALAPAAAQSSPVNVVRSRNQAVRAVLDVEGDSVSGQVREELKDLINGLMDFRELSRRALGKYWEERTEQERSEFVDVFRRLVRNSSVRKLSVHRADSIVYAPPKIRGEEATVTTTAHKGRRSVEIVYHMHRSNGEWKAYDVVIDESSTMRTYRDSFYREIAATSYPAMFARLVEKLEEESGASS